MVIYFGPCIQNISDCHYSVTTLSCGHPCISKCHELSDHSKRKCKEKLSSKCPIGHLQIFQCHSPPQKCEDCELAKRMAEEKRKNKLHAQERNAAEEKQHLQSMDKINAEIEEEKRLQDEELRKKQLTNAKLKKQFELDSMRFGRMLTSTPGCNPASYICGADP